MRKYDTTEKQKLIKVVCNKCGNELKIENGMLKEGHYQGEVNWGYFSNKDGMCHSFDLCEKCYDAIVSSFCVPIDERLESELV